MSTLRVSIEAWGRYAAARLMPCPANVIGLKRLAADAGAFLKTPCLTRVGLAKTLHAAGWSDRLIFESVAGRPLITLQGYRLAGDPSPAEFLARHLTGAAGARVPLARVADLLATQRANDIPYNRARVRAVVDAALPGALVQCGTRPRWYIEGFRLVSDRTPLQFLTTQLIADADALTPLSRITSALNRWCKAPDNTAPAVVGRLLTELAIGATSALDLDNGRRIYVLRGWRLAEDPPVAEFLQRLVPEPGAETPVEAIAAAFNEHSPSGVVWSVRRMGEVLRSHGWTLKLLRRAGVNRIFVIGCKLSEDSSVGRRRALRAVQIADDLIDLAAPALTDAHLQRLAASGIKTRDALADLAGDELRELLGRSLSSRAADAIIMAARAHWFAPSPAAAA